MKQDTPIPTTLDEAEQYARLDARIVAWAGYGKHITLTCKNHPTLTWSTKNIDYIGARNIFAQDGTCDCSARALVPVVPEDWQAVIVKIPHNTCTYCDRDMGERENGYAIYNCSSCGYLRMWLREYAREAYDVLDGIDREVTWHTMPREALINAVALLQRQYLWVDVGR